MLSYISKTLPSSKPFQKLVAQNNIYLIFPLIQRVVWVVLLVYASLGGARWFQVGVFTCLGQLGSFSVCPSSSRRLAQAHSHGGRKVPSHRRGASSNGQVLPKSLFASHLLISKGAKESHMAKQVQGLDSIHLWMGQVVKSCSHTEYLLGWQEYCSHLYIIPQAAPSQSDRGIGSMSSSF